MPTIPPLRLRPSSPAERCGTHRTRLSACRPLRRGGSTKASEPRLRSAAPPSLRPPSRMEEPLERSRPLRMPSSSACLWGVH